MALNRDFTFPEKDLGEYGNLDYTWNFTTHWPELTLDYIENQTGVNLDSELGDTAKAKTQIKQVSKLSKLYLFDKLLRDTKTKLEYIVAKDQEILYEVLEYQSHIFTHGFINGAWLTMYDDDNDGKPTIGAAAEIFLQSSNLLTTRWNLHIDQEDIRKDY